MYVSKIYLLHYSQKYWLGTINIGNLVGYNYVGFKFTKQRNWTLFVPLQYHYTDTVQTYMVFTFQKELECIHGILTLRAFSSLPDRLCVCLYFHVFVSLTITANTTCDFERGGAMKLIGSSWNNGTRNCLDLYQIQKRPNLIMLSVFHWLWHLYMP